MINAIDQQQPHTIRRTLRSAVGLVLAWVGVLTIESACSTNASSGQRDEVGSAVAALSQATTTPEQPAQTGTVVPPGEEKSFPAPPIDSAHSGVLGHSRGGPTKH